MITIKYAIVEGAVIEMCVPMTLYSGKRCRDVTLDVQPCLAEDHEWEILPKTFLMLNQVKPTAEMAVLLFVLECQWRNSGMKTVVEENVGQSERYAHKETSVR